MITKNCTNKTNNNTYRIPTREEFHRFVSNELSESDFCTNYPSGHQVRKIASAINWTYNNEKNNNYNYKNKNLEGKL